MTLLGARAGPGALKFEGWSHTLAHCCRGLCWLREKKLVRNGSKVPGAFCLAG
jgi:hypothetical protein